MTMLILKSGHQLLLREAETKDAKSIIEYLNIVGGESDNLLFGKNEFTHTVEQEIEYIKDKEQNTDTLLLLGIIEDKIVSLAHINSLSQRRIAHYSEMSITVKQEYQGLGIGTAVMKELIKFAKENSLIKYISLGVKASNEKAISLYQKFGFKRVGVHKDYFNVNGIYDDEILMDLSLQH